MSIGINRLGHRTGFRGCGQYLAVRSGFHLRLQYLGAGRSCAPIVRVVRGIVELAGWFAVTMLALGLMASNAKADTPRSFDEARAAYHQLDWTGWEEDEILDDGVRFLRYTMPTGDALNLTLRVVEADTAQDVEFSVRCAEREWKFGLMTSYEEPGVNGGAKSCHWAAQ